MCSMRRVSSTPVTDSVSTAPIEKFLRDATCMVLSMRCVVVASRWLRRKPSSRAPARPMATHTPTWEPIAACTVSVDRGVATGS